MSTWKVSKERIELFTHPNADSLELGKVGSYQVVVQKGLYKDGDEVIFAPEKSVLTGDIKIEFENYLTGSNKDRIKSIRLRNEISSGIIIPNFLIENFEDIIVGEDISEKLGITKFEPSIPIELAGIVKSHDMDMLGFHDCEQANIYVKDLVKDERVVISEKIHGSQIIIGHDIDRNITIVSSKGIFKSGLVIEESDTNTYWKAVYNDKIVEIIRENYKEGIIQIFGEVIPVQGGYSYGQSTPTLRIFDIRLDRNSIPYDKVPDKFKNIWVPIIYDGTLDLEEKEVILYVDEDKGIRKVRVDNILPKDVIDLCKGRELVSGKSLHIREGVVIQPYIDRYANDGTRLRLKIINPAYKESGEEIN